MRSLLLLRHATTESVRPGHGDLARRLTPEGEREAEGLRRHLSDAGIRFDLVLCSPATRAQQTLQGLAATAPVVLSDRLYEAGGDEIIDVVRELPDDVRHLLVVGHAPGLPAVVHELADPEVSDPQALASVRWRFPPATLAALEFDGAWLDLERAALVSARLP
jgi:phosphohistidine phosphatase